MRRALVAAVMALVVAAGVVVGLDVSGNLPGGLVGDSTPTPTPTRPLDPSPVAADDVLPPEPEASASAAPAELPVGALERVLASGALGPDPGAVVVDVTTAESLLAQDDTTARTPASVAKLTTGAAALRRLDPDSRLRTRVVAGTAADEVVLVGAGDASLSSRRASAASYPSRASLADLADQVAVSLIAQGRTAVRVQVDDSLFSGPAVSPDWPAGYVASGVVSPVSALSVDAGRVRPGADIREPDPALAAGRTLASLLTRRGVTADPQVTRATAAATATELGAVESPTIAELVELMLETSDNDLAEALLRLVAIGSDRPGTFVDGRAVVTDVLDELGVGDPATDLLDGSGLARGSTVSPDVLARLLVAAADPQRAELWRLLTGLPVAGFTGTLSSRFVPDVRPARAAAGEVRAKTGTLTGVSTLAGTATVGDQPVVFVVMADQVTNTLEARAALDAFAGLVANT